MLTWAEREHLRAAAGLPRPPSSHLLRRVLPSVERFIHHELVLMEREHELPRGWITAEEVLDRVVAFARQPNDLPTVEAFALARALEQEALDILFRAADQAISEEQTSVFLDEDVLEPMELEVELDTDLGASTFWQPDEDLLRADQIGDEGPTDAESLAVAQETRGLLTQALFNLPKTLRRLFSSSVIDGWSRASLASALGREVSEVGADVDLAVAFIASQLSQGEEVWTSEKVFEAYRSLGDRIRGEGATARVAAWRGQTRDPRFHTIDKTTQHTLSWLDDVTYELGWGDRHHAWRATGAVLHALRDELTVVEAAQLSAQLPLLLRGLFFERWQPSPDGKPTGPRHGEDFLRRISEGYGDGLGDVKPRDLGRAVFAVLANRVSAGEMDDVWNGVSRSIRAVWPDLTLVR